MAKISCLKVWYPACNARSGPRSKHSNEEPKLSGCPKVLVFRFALARVCASFRPLALLLPIKLFFREFLELFLVLVAKVLIKMRAALQAVILDSHRGRLRKWPVALVIMLGRLQHCPPSCRAVPSCEVEHCRAGSAVPRVSRFCSLVCYRWQEPVEWSSGCGIGDRATATLSLMLLQLAPEFGFQGALNWVFSAFGLFNL